ncbi:MAG: M24 family metallopeptidase [Opitutales bacterium]
MAQPSRRSAAKTARLLYAESERNADMRYFSGMRVPDAFLAFEFRGKRHGVFSALEFNRARHEGRFDEVLSLEDLQKATRETLGDAAKGPAHIVRLLGRQHGFTQVEVPEDFPTGVAFALQEAGLRVEVVEGAFFPQRALKTAEEAQFIAEGCAASAAGIRAAEQALRRASIDERRFLRLDGKRLTSERLRTLVDSACLEKGAVAFATICAGGDQACDPHCAGSGPLRADALIIVDVFPQVSKTGYYGDMTRTFLKGRASEAQKRLVATVAEAQQRVLTTLKAGISGKRAHEAAAQYFVDEGYQTGQADGVYSGFFHGTGHGLGLDVHEAPRVSSRVADKLRRGMVVTVEPGLYYPGLGGCRIEDVVQIERDGCRKLSKAPYRWHLRR